MNNNYSGSLLLAEVVRHPKRAKTDHAHKSGKQPRSHGLKSPNEKINMFLSKSLVRDKYPNFFAIGFRAQAFIDIRLSQQGSSAEIANHSAKVRNKLNEIGNVILIYTVFGNVDLRCKIVGIDLRHIERIAMEIRSIEGVQDSVTSIVVDETEYDNARLKWAHLIEENKESIEAGLGSV